MSIYDLAFDLVASGVSVVPIRVDGSKAPAIQTWKQYQQRRPTEPELRADFSNGRGIAIIGGKVSGGLEILDFDEPGVCAEWQTRAVKEDPWIDEVIGKLPHVRTPAGGDHVFYRCPEIAGNQKLAMVAGDNGHSKIAIETRGEAGYVLTPGCPSSCHPAGKPYKLLNGSLTKIPMITAEQRQTLLDAARSFDEQPKATKPTATSRTCGNTGGRPGDDFAARHEWSELLEPHGWKKVSGRGEVTDWRRPGKDGKGSSATTGYGSDLLYVFSSNAEPFDPDTSYSKFAAFTLLEHGGDFKKAAKALGKRGYGRQQRALQAEGDGCDDGNGSTDPNRPAYTYHKGQAHDAVDFALPKLTETTTIYQRSQGLVHVIPAEGGTDRQRVTREAGSPVIADLPIALVREELSRLIAWQRYDARKNKDLPSEPPTFVVDSIHSRGYWPGLRELRGITTSPIFRPDGTVCTTPGFDEPTGLLYESSGPVPAIPDKPTLEDARQATTELLDVVTDFPFVGPAHRAAWLAALLSPIAWPAYEDGAPLFAFDASTPAAGKGLLVHTIALIVTGRRMSVSPWVDTDNEMRKAITSRVLSGDGLALIDNVPGDGCIGWPSLDAALTGETWSDRILGRNEITRLPLNIVWYSTGNNMLVGHDAARRVIKSRLEVKEEHPEERTDFEHEPLLPWVRENRLRLLAAALTILRAYFVAGRPSQGLAPLGSFEGWSNLVRSAVVWLGLKSLADPVDCLASKDPDADPMAGAHRDLLVGWLELEKLIGDRGKQTSLLPSPAEQKGSGLTAHQALGALHSDILNKAHRHDEMIAALGELLDVDGIPTAQKLGAILRGLKGRWRKTDSGRNLCFKSRRDPKNVCRWTVAER